MKGYNEHDIGNSQVLFYHSDLPKSKTPIIPLPGQAVASIGHEPTFDNYAKVSLEPTIFDQCVVLSLLNTCTSWQETPISVLHMHIDPPQKHLLIWHIGTPAPLFLSPLFPFFLQLRVDAALSHTNAHTHTHTHTHTHIHTLSHNHRKRTL